MVNGEVFSKPFRSPAGLFAVYAVAYSIAAITSPPREFTKDVSAKNALDDFGGLDAGEFHVEALEGVGEAVAVQTQLMQHGGVQVADVNHVLDGTVA